MNTEDRGQKSEDKKPDDGGYAKWAGLGFEFVGVLAIFCYMGYRLDKALNTTRPWFLITGFAIGFIGMFYRVFKESWYLWRK